MFFNKRTDWFIDVLTKRKVRINQGAQDPNSKSFLELEQQLQTQTLNDPSIHL